MYVFVSDGPKNLNPKSRIPGRAHLNMYPGLRRGLHKRNTSGALWWLQPLDAPTGCVYGSWMCATRFSDRLQIQTQARLGM